MDSDLSRSLRMLEDVVSVQGRGLLKNTLLKNKAAAKKKEINMSMTLNPDELRYLEEEAGFNVTEYERTFNSIIEANKSLTGTVIRNEPWKRSIDVLYVEFLEVLQTRTGGHDVLEVVQDLQRCCSDALNVIKGLKSKVHVTTSQEEICLENERNTWRLLFILYQDRLNSMALEEDPEEQLPYFGNSEKVCIENLFQRDQLIRECQLVIDWLESCAALRDDEVLHFSDSTTGWENTLHDLKGQECGESSRARKIVTHLDPDAPHYEKLPLHDVDMDDDRKLCYKIFTEIRCGKLEEAQKLCENCGHSWRAALLEGWRLYHNPNIKEKDLSKATADLERTEADKMNIDSDNETDPEDEVDSKIEENWETKDIEGNENRDIWKNMAWKYTEMDNLNKHEKAAVAAYSGHLKPLLIVGNNWEDFLWAYMRVMVDIRVESEIRDNVSKKYLPLPNEYWDQKMSMNDIFAALESSKHQTVTTEAAKPSHIIQKLIILDEIEKLMSKIEEWLDEPTATHFLRFITHLVLFFEQIGQTQRRDVIERVLEGYITRLMEMEDTALVAFYVSKMGSLAQVQLFASYLEKITNNEERKEALNYGESCGLNIFTITKRVVENIRNIPHSVSGTGDLQQKITEVDDLKISALDWVLFYEAQRAEALYQSNALIFTFLALRKLDAAQLVYNKLPSNIIDHLLLEGEVSDQLSQAIKEHLSYKAYLDAHEGFNNWFKMFKSRPIAPPELPENAQFTEKVAHQHQMSQFKAETERWKLTTSHLAKTAKALLYNVLLFPDGGWLHGAKEADYLRSNCIPECVLLLFSVLYESGFHEECVQLADILASEKHQLYKVYTKEKLGEILTKLCESSVALLNEKKDPWGNETSA